MTRGNDRVGRDILATPPYLYAGRNIRALGEVARVDYSRPRQDADRRERRLSADEGEFSRSPILPMARIPRRVVRRQAPLFEPEKTVGTSGMFGARLFGQSSAVSRFERDGVEGVVLDA